MSDAFLQSLVLDDPRRVGIEQGRYLGCKRTLAPLADLYRGKRVLDFGASYALSMCAVMELGAREVVGVEIDAERVERGRGILEACGFADRAELLHTTDTAHLPLEGESFDFVLCNAVLEHIPQPRGAYIAEMWRVLRPDGSLLIADTPNRYHPFDSHTTGLWFVPWMPRDLARRYATRRGKWSAEREARDPWFQCGWRGLGHYELTGALPKGGYRYIPERGKPRHAILSALGLPASLVDPYPVWLVEKTQGHPA